MEKAVTPEQKRMDQLIKSFIDLCVKLENQHEGLTKYAYTLDFKKIEQRLNNLYKDNRLDNFINVFADARNYWIGRMEKMNQVEMKL